MVVQIMTVVIAKIFREEEEEEVEVVGWVKKF